MHRLLIAALLGLCLAACTQGMSPSNHPVVFNQNNDGGGGGGGGGGGY
jgi:hypothetical protein